MAFSRIHKFPNFQKKWKGLQLVIQLLLSGQKRTFFKFYNSYAHPALVQKPLQQSVPLFFRSVIQGSKFPRKTSQERKVFQDSFHRRIQHLVRPVYEVPQNLVIVWMNFSGQLKCKTINKIKNSPGCSTTRKKIKSSPS